MGDPLTGFRGQSEMLDHNHQLIVEYHRQPENGRNSSSESLI